MTGKTDPVPPGALPLLLRYYLLPSLSAAPGLLIEAAMFSFSCSNCSLLFACFFFFYSTLTLPSLSTLVNIFFYSPRAILHHPFPPPPVPPAALSGLDYIFSLTGRSPITLAQLLLHCRTSPLEWGVGYHPSYLTDIAGTVKQKDLEADILLRIVTLLARSASI